MYLNDRQKNVPCIKWRKKNSFCVKVFIWFVYATAHIYPFLLSYFFLLRQMNNKKKFNNRKYIKWITKWLIFFSFIYGINFCFCVCGQKCASKKKDKSKSKRGKKVSDNANESRPPNLYFARTMSIFRTYKNIPKRIQYCITNYCTHFFHSKKQHSSLLFSVIKKNYMYNIFCSWINSPKNRELV